MDRSTHLPYRKNKNSAEGKSDIERWWRIMAWKSTECRGSILTGWLVDVKPTVWLILWRLIILTEADVNKHSTITWSLLFRYRRAGNTYQLVRQKNSGSSAEIMMLKFTIYLSIFNLQILSIDKCLHVRQIRTLGTKMALDRKGNLEKLMLDQLFHGGGNGKNYGKCIHDLIKTIPRCTWTYQKQKKLFPNGQNEDNYIIRHTTPIFMIRQIF